LRCCVRCDGARVATTQRLLAVWIAANGQWFEQREVLRDQLKHHASWLHSLGEQVPRATRIMQRASCDLQRAMCDMQRAARNLQHATQPASTRRASMRRATCNIRADRFLHGLRPRWPSRLRTCMTSAAARRRHGPTGATAHRPLASKVAFPPPSCEQRLPSHAC
jgi:hypothetical protein